MPIYPVNNSKIVVLNEDKTRGVIFEFPVDMEHDEMLGKIDELRFAITESKKKMEEKKPEKTSDSSGEIS